MLNTCYVPGNVLGLWDRVLGDYSLFEGDRPQTNKYTRGMSSGGGTEMWKTESVRNGARLGRCREALSVEWLGGKPDRNASTQERTERVGCETPQNQPLTKVVR